MLNHTRVNWSDIVKAARETSEALNGKDWVGASIRARVLLADLADVTEGLLDASKAALGFLDANAEVSELAGKSDHAELYRHFADRLKAAISRATHESERDK